MAEDMADDTGYTNIKDMYFKFKKHIYPKYDQAHSHLTDAFASNIDIDTLFEDGEAQTKCCLIYS